MNACFFFANHGILKQTVFYLICNYFKERSNCMYSKSQQYMQNFFGSYQEKLSENHLIYWLAYLH